MTRYATTTPTSATSGYVFQRSTTTSAESAISANEANTVAITIRTSMILVRSRCSSNSTVASSSRVRSIATAVAAKPDSASPRPTAGRSSRESGTGLAAADDQTDQETDRGGNA